MSLTASPLADALHAATIHRVELDDFGHSFRPVAPGLFTGPIDVARLEALDHGDELRELPRARALGATDAAPAPARRGAGHRHLRVVAVLAAGSDGRGPTRRAMREARSARRRMCQIRTSSDFGMSSIATWDGNTIAHWSWVAAYPCDCEHGR